MRRLAPTRFATRFPSRISTRASSLRPTCSVAGARFLTLALVLLLATTILAAAEVQRPKPRPANLVEAVPETIPEARWDHRSESDRWTRGALAALRDHGQPLVRSVPGDIGQWCPGYRSAPEAARRGFWVGFLSALAKHESRWRPRVVGGGGRWFGLLQILPATARGYGCRARSGEDLLLGAANLSCAVRILSVTVPRDGVIHAREPRWSGVAADWGPMRSPEKREEMAGWLRSQEYCQRTSSPRPVPRPSDLEAGPSVTGPPLGARRPAEAPRLASAASGFANR